ncbi:peroxidase family protein [Aspergillus alliaceus]|uniref:peroxidase family protein n=1 Tax=Petromyces alliaceus TaxID=209559 RepID=UPI0012A54BE6|nr:Chloroperoxidase [Aspergillus alliaceus]KAB8236469.1 Chloroperoxidase [Aspergillus alliaceus]
MKFSFISTALVFTLASANPHYGQWKPAGPKDFRGPCPMMNTLANHGFLPHDGRNLTRHNVVKGLSAALNFNASLASLMFDMAIIVNPEPNATFFTLDQLNKHNLLEHDASLSRTDAYFGNNYVFNDTIFEETKKYWTGPILDANMLANSKVARQIESKAFNPTYTFTSTMEQFSLGEVAAPIIAFGDMQHGKVNRSLVEYFFKNERFPTELGWKRREKIVGQSDIMGVTQMIANATNLITPANRARAESRRDLHSGLGI